MLAGPDMEDEMKPGGDLPSFNGIEAAIASGNIQKVGADAETYDLSVGSKKERDLQEQKYNDLLLKRKARAMVIPTNPAEVRERLRELGQPVTLFGEREMERRDRLREFVVKLDASGQLDGLQPHGHSKRKEVKETSSLPTGVFYTEGTKQLLQARELIAQFSIPRARDRILKAASKFENPDEDLEKEADFVLGELSSKLEMQCSEIGDDRPLSGCSFSPDASMVATCSWSGMAKIWSLPTISKLDTFKGHTERVTDVAFHPKYRSSQNLDPNSDLDQETDPNTVSIATASADRTAILWGSSGRQIGKLTGHLDRLARLAFHPSGKFLGTASFDKTWRLWDVETSEELLLQEGHSRSVYALGFHCDGSLAASGGLDAISRVWDLRTGKSVLTLEGHVKSILGLDFSPNGYLLATASEDHSCRIWDLRKKRCLYVIPAHSSLVSQVKFEPVDGHFLVTGSYDNTARVWSSLDFKPVRTLAGHEGKVMGVDVAADGQYIATVSYDRTIKLWYPDKASAMDEMF